ncbi:MAG: preprotein translocase subunit SecE [Verrucomicrobiae bacterium]|nr:preprotein translocase subunit SecE [Verrucomicrobiae bacterium]MDW8344585.1 preprotein translocase subunit SecE [Verrucomicrobiae bacterium]
MSNPFIKVREFIDEVVTELKRSQWPTRKELVDSTLLVLVLMLVLGLFVSLVDVVFVRVIQWLTGAA